MGDMSLRERKRRFRSSPLQHTSGNAGTPRIDQHEDHIQDDYRFYKADVAVPSEANLLTIPDNQPVAYEENAAPGYLPDSVTRSPSTTADGFAGDHYGKYRKRENQQKCKVTGLPLWSPRAEYLYAQFSYIIPPIFKKQQIRCKLLTSTKDKAGRNDLLGYLLSKWNAPVEYTRKILSSHKQVVNKHLHKDGNQELLKLMDKSETGDIDIKDLWFDEESLSLKTGDPNSSSGTLLSMSHFMAAYDQYLPPSGKQKHKRTICSIDFKIAVYQKCIPYTEIHTCTTIQSPGGAPDKSIVDVQPHFGLFPQLQDILEHDENCEILWFDSAIKFLEQMPPPESRLGIDFIAEIANDEDYRDWHCKTNFYRRNGEPFDGEIVRTPEKITQGHHGARLKLHLPLFSPFWMKTLYNRQQQREEVIMKYRLQLEALQHGACICEACQSLSSQMQEELAEHDEFWKRQFQEVSIMKSIFATPCGATKPRRVAVFLFKLSQASGVQMPLTTWQRVVRAKVNPPDVALNFNTLPQPDQDYGLDYTGGHNAWMQATGQHYPAIGSGPEDTYSQSTQQITPTDSTYSGQSRGSLYSITSTNALVPTNYATHLEDGNKMQHYADAQAHRNYNLETTCYNSQPLVTIAPQPEGYRNGSGFRQFDHMDFANLQNIDFSFDGYGNHDSFAGLAGGANLDLQQILPSTAADIPVRTEAINDVARLQPSVVHAPQPRRIITTAHLSSPIVMTSELVLTGERLTQQLRRMRSVEQQEPVIEQEDGICADGSYLRATAQNNGHQFQHDEHQYQNPEQAVYDSTKHILSVDGSHDLSSTHQHKSYDIERALSAMTNPQEQQSIYSTSTQQLSLLASTYEHPSLTQQDIPSYYHHGIPLLPPPVLSSHINDNNKPYLNNPAPLPSQHLPSPTSSPQLQHDNALHSDATITQDWASSHVAGPRREETTLHSDATITQDWPPTTHAQDANSWVLDLAIARTEDMIERAHASELDVLATAAVEIQGRGMADGGQPVGRILGESDSTTEHETLLPAEHMVQQAVPHSHELRSDDTLDLENLPRLDEILASVAAAQTHGSDSQEALHDYHLPQLQIAADSAITVGDGSSTGIEQEGGEQWTHADLQELDQEASEAERFALVQHYNTRQSASFAEWHQNHQVVSGFEGMQNGANGAEGLHEVLGDRHTGASEAIKVGNDSQHEAGVLMAAEAASQQI